MAFVNRLIYHALGHWPIGNVSTHAVADNRQRAPEVEAFIDEAWRRTLSNPGTKTLFDGPICRLDRWAASPGELNLFLSLTSYRVFVGTHLSGGEIFTTWGRPVMANPLGVSCVLETSDGWLLLGRRNNTVAYYPDRIHPFAGSLDPRRNPAPNVFDEIRRELSEEILLGASEMSELRCVALVEDVLLHHPELIFTAKTPRTRAEMEAGLDRSEHSGMEAARTERESLELLLQNPKMTPVALASVALCGRQKFGEAWFRRSADDR